MKLIAYRLNNLDLPIRPCSIEREWMEYFERFPYKCLPLTIANGTGWDVLMNADLEFVWDGGPTTQNLKILNKSEENYWCSSHFGMGILTMNLPYLFRTPKGVDLWVRGPSNLPNPQLCALEGLVETWWNPFTFTMNWRCLVKNEKIVLRKGDVACRIVPFPHAYLPQFEPVILDIREDPELQRQYAVWNVSRNEFNARGIREGWAGLDWQKHYTLGHNFATDEKVPDHVTKVKTAEFLTARRREGVEGLGAQLAELLATGLADEEVLDRLEDETLRKARGGAAVTSLRLVRAFRELWQIDDRTRFLIRYGSGGYHSQEFDSYEAAVAVADRLPDSQIVRVQI